MFLVENAHEAIVSKEIFEEVQRRKNRTCPVNNNIHEICLNEVIFRKSLDKVIYYRYTVIEYIITE